MLFTSKQQVLDLVISVLMYSVSPFTSLSSGFKSVSYLNTIYTEFALTSLLCFANRIICIEVNQLPLGAFQSMSSCPDFHGHHAITRTTECVMWWSMHTLSDLHTISLTFTPTGKERKKINTYSGRTGKRREGTIGVSEQKDSIMVGCLYVWLQQVFPLSATQTKMLL